MIVSLVLLYLMLLEYFMSIQSDYRFNLGLERNKVELALGKIRCKL